MSGKQKRALVIADVQVDFCPGGALGVPRGDEIVPLLNRLITDFLQDGDIVVKSRDWHPPNTNHFALYGGTWPVHCVRGTPGAEFHPDLRDDPRIVVFSKGLGDGDSYSAFDGTGLANFLREHDVKEVWVGGLATDYCVKDTVLDALREGFEVTLLKETVRAVDLVPGNGERAIAEMELAGAHILLDYARIVLTV